MLIADGARGSRKTKKGNMGKELYEGLNLMPPAEGFELSRHKNAEQMTTQGWSGLYWARMNERSSRKFHRVRPRQCQNLYTNPTPTRPNFRVRREGLGGRGVESGLLWRALRERSLDRLRRGASRAGGPNPLGWHGDRGGMEWLHGRGGTLRRTRRPRSAPLLSTRAPGTCGKFIRGMFHADTFASFTRVRRRASSEVRLHDLP